MFGPFRKACEFVRSGRIGKIQQVTVGVGGPSMWCDLPEEEVEPGLDWNLWLGPAPLRPYQEANTWLDYESRNPWQLPHA